MQHTVQSPSINIRDLMLVQW